jgi:peroxiredoxin
MIEKNNLEFEVLTDIDNNFAKKLGIVFQLQDFVLPYYKVLEYSF